MKELLRALWEELTELQSREDDARSRRAEAKGSVLGLNESTTLDI
jgi:hypothetical protein